MIIYTGSQTFPIAIMSVFRTKLYMQHLLYWKKFQREEIFAVLRKIGAICEIKFPRKIVFWIIRENKLSRKFFFVTRENKFLHFLFTYLIISTDVYNTLQHNIKKSLIEDNKRLDQSFSLLSVFAFNPFCDTLRSLQEEIPVLFISPPHFIFHFIPNECVLFLKNNNIP